MLGIEKPVLLAGMNGIANANLAAAVSNAGGLGSIGGVSYTPKMLQKEIDELKRKLEPGKPFGVDLLLPKVGGSARKTNKDYTKGKLPELVDIICAAKPALFISAVGLPPEWVVKKLHEHGILIMNMCGRAKHAVAAAKLGADIVCVQGGQGGGHTGEIAFNILVPQTVDAVNGMKSEFTGKQIPVIAAGGVYDGRGLAAALSYGAQAVWVGTRFIVSKESGAGKLHRQGVIDMNVTDSIRSTIYTGRPMRVIKNATNVEYESTKLSENQKLRDQGIIPIEAILKEKQAAGEEISFVKELPLLVGQVGGVISEADDKPARQIIDEMVNDAAQIIQRNNSIVSRL